MTNTNILLTTLLFSSLLVGCGLKGPLYHAPVEKPKAKTLQQTEQQPQSSLKTSSKKLDSASDSTTVNK